MYHFRDTSGPVDLAFTDRSGGVSGAPWDSLNLAVSGPDNEAAKAENHRLLMADFAPGATLVDLYQVHSARVVEAIPGVRAEADGLVSDRDDVVLLVRAADCVPVLFADPRGTVIGAAHAGRAGMVAGVASATVQAMRALGAEQIEAWIGPSICGDCYEVPAPMQAEVIAVEPAAAATTSWGTPALDIAAGVQAQLERLGVAVHRDGGGCTREDSTLFSYRRDGDSSGRLAGVIRRRAVAA